jgi:hypothetical protein
MVGGNDSSLPKVERKSSGQNSLNPGKRSADEDMSLSSLAFLIEK